MGSKYTLKHGGQGQHYGKETTEKRLEGWEGVVLCISEKSIWDQENTCDCTWHVHFLRTARSPVRLKQSEPAREQERKSGKWASEKNLAFIVNETESCQSSQSEKWLSWILFLKVTVAAVRRDSRESEDEIKDTSSVTAVEIQGLLSQHCETKYENCKCPQRKWEKLSALA